MEGRSDNGAGIARKTIAPEVGGGLRFLLSLRRPRPGAAAMRQPSLPLELRRRAVAGHVAPGLLGGLPFAMGISPRLAAWAFAASDDRVSQAPAAPSVVAERSPVTAPALPPPRRAVSAVGAGATPRPAVRWAPAAVALVAPTMATARAPGVESTARPFADVASRSVASPASIVAPGGGRAEPVLVEPRPSAYEPPMGGERAAGRSDAAVEKRPAEEEQGGESASPQHGHGRAAHTLVADLVPSAWSLWAGLARWAIEPTGPRRAAGPHSLPGNMLGATLLPVRGRPREASSPARDLPHVGPGAEGVAWASLAERAGVRLEAAALGGGAPAPPAAVASEWLAAGVAERTLAASPVLVDRRPASGTRAALPVLEAPLRRWVAGEVNQQVVRATERPAPAPQPPPVDVSSDDFVRRLMTRIRTIAQEERFRGGFLR